MIPCRTLGLGAAGPSLLLPIPAARQRGGPEEREAGQRGWKASSPALPNSTGSLGDPQRGAVTQARLRKGGPCSGKAYSQSWACEDSRQPSLDLSRR